MKRKSIIIIFLILSFAKSNAQTGKELGYADDSNFPKGKAGVTIENLILTVNSNDTAQVREFVEKYFSKDFRKSAEIEEFQNYFLDIFRQTGGIKFHSIRKYTPAKSEVLVIILKDVYYESWCALTVNTLNEHNMLISKLQYTPARTPSNVTNPEFTETQVIKQVNDCVGRLSINDLFSGTVLLAKGDQILLEKSCGEASKSYHIKNNIHTKFNLGSMNKMFTSVAIMQLIEKEDLKLNDHLSKYLDETWLPKQITEKVTIRNLLTHSSGLGSYFNSTYWNSSRELYRKVEDFKPLVHSDTLLFTPGTQYRYSNTGMLLLGAIIEEVTNQDYFEYIRKHVYKVAEMENSDSYELDQPIDNLAVGYIRTNINESGWENNIFKHVIKGGPAGGGYSNAYDLHNFSQALVNQELVSKESSNLMWTDHLNSNYGFGFSIKENSNEKIVGHSGGFPGLNSQLDIYLDSGYVVVVMSNYDMGAHRLCLKINELINSISK